MLWSRLAGRGDSPFIGGTRQRGLLHLLGRALWPGRHGETGTMLAELYLFASRRRLRAFRQAGFTTREVRPIGLFYTGNMLLGARLGLGPRRRLARWLGSGSTLYIVAAQ